MPKSYMYTLNVGFKGCIYTADIDLVIICRVDRSIKGEVKSKIIEASIKATVDDTKKILTRALPGGVGNADNNVNNFDIMPICWVRVSIKMVVDSKIVETLTRTVVGNAENVVII